MVMILGHNKIHNEIKGECERERQTGLLIIVCQKMFCTCMLIASECTR